MNKGHRSAVAALERVDNNREAWAERAAWGKTTSNRHRADGFTAPPDSPCWRGWIITDTELTDSPRWRGRIIIDTALTDSPR